MILIHMPRFRVLFCAVAVVFNRCLQDSKYRDFPESVKTLFEMLLGNMDLATLRAINPYLAPLFFYLYLTVMVMVVLSIFVAVVNSAYEDTRETLAMPEYCFARDDLWCYCNNVDDLAPCQGSGQLWQVCLTQGAHRRCVVEAHRLMCFCFPSFLPILANVISGLSIFRTFRLTFFTPIP